jgi:CRP-like cAMP-binding protein
MDAILKNCTIINFKKTETIVKQGTEVTHSLYLSQGSVKIFIEGEKNIILKLIKADTYIGLGTVFGDKLYPFSISTLEDSRVCLTPINTVYSIAGKNNDYLLNIMKLITTSKNYLYKKIIDIGINRLKSRVADSILYLSEYSNNSSEFEIILSRNELAEFSAMSMENTVRILAEFRANKIIELKGRTIKILDKEKLQKIAKDG